VSAAATLFGPSVLRATSVRNQVAVVSTRRLRASPSLALQPTHETLSPPFSVWRRRSRTFWRFHARESSGCIQNAGSPRALKDAITSTIKDILSSSSFKVRVVCGRTPGRPSG
jgi:hypothetical protein